MINNIPKRQQNSLIISFKQISKVSFFVYIITLFIFVDNIELNFISEIAFICFAFFSIIYICINKLYFEKYLYLLLFFGISFLSILWASDVSLAQEMSFTLFKLMALYILTYNVFADEKDLSFFAKAIFWGGMLMCIYSLFYYGLFNVIEALLSGKRLGTEINQINTFGMYSAVTCIVGLYFAIIEKKRIYFVVLFLPFVFVIASASRKALLMIPLAAMLLLFFKFGTKQFYKFAFYMGLFLVIFLILLQFEFMEFALKRFQGFINIFTGGNIDSSTSVRFNMIRYGLQFFKDKPILGYGINNYRVIYAAVHTETYSHNNFIELLVNLGIIGFIAYYVVFIYLIIALLKVIRYNQTKIFILTILLINFVMDFGVVSYYSKLTYIYFVLAYLEIRKGKNESYEKNSIKNL